MAWLQVKSSPRAMRSKGWKSSADVLPLAIVHDGYTRLIMLQNDGYAYIGGF